MAIEHVVNTRREFQILNEVQAEERQVEHAVASRFLALNCNGLTVGVDGVVEAAAVADKLKLDTREKLFVHQGHAQIQFSQMIR